MAQQVPEDAPSETQRRRDPAAAGGAVQSPTTAHRHAPDAGRYVEVRAALPLTPRQVRHLMALSEVRHDAAVAPLGPADRVRIEAIVDEGDAHGRTCGFDPAYPRPRNPR